MKKRLNAANNTPADTKHFAVAASADEVGLQLTKMKAELRKDNTLAKPRMFIFNEFSEAHTLVMRTYGNSKKKTDQVKVQMPDQSDGLRSCPLSSVQWHTHENPPSFSHCMNKLR